MVHIHTVHVWRSLPDYTSSLCDDHFLIHTSPSYLQGVEDDNETLNSQISLLEDQLKMASVASKRKVEGIEIKHSELGEKLQELLRLHKDIATDLVAWAMLLKVLLIIVMSVLWNIIFHSLWRTLLVW